MILAFDDTDRPEGGCTTYALFQVLAALPDLAPRGMPRLVRLNPNVPWKTRGNGAVCVELVQPTGPHVVVGEWMGMELRAYPEGAPAPADEVALDAAWGVLQELAQADAMPAMALFDSAPSPLHYWQAVRMVMDPVDAVAYARTSGVLHRAKGNGRALIGCLGAAAWPGPAASYEFIAYRERSAWGTPRAVNEAPLRGLDHTGRTFHTEDPEKDALCCVPNTPCPVLLGLRGHDPEGLLQTARSTVPSAAGEPLEGWILWASNQASGDHITPVSSLAEATEGMTVRLPATVAESPANLEGGHVQVTFTDGDMSRFDVMAFEPTGTFRAVVRRLLPGDGAEVTGAWNNGTVRLESLRVIDAGPAKSANPHCTECDRSMKSRGRAAGYRCPSCGASVASDAATFTDRSDLVGTYEVPVMTRRHLHRPLAWPPTSTPPAGRDASAPTSAATR